MSPKFTSLALTFHLDFGLTANNSLQSHRYVKLYTFETELDFLQPYSSSLCMSTCPFWFSCPKPRSQPHFLSFPQHPLQSICILNCNRICWLCLQNIFWVYPLLSTFVPVTSPSSNAPPLPNLEEKPKLPARDQMPTYQLSSSGILPLNLSSVSVSMLPSNHPVFHLQDLCTCLSFCLE